MKLPYNMWMVALISIAKTKGATGKEGRLKAITDAAEFKYSEDDISIGIKEVSTIKKIASLLSEMDIEDNPKLKKAFFNEWKKAYIHSKIEFFKGEFLDNKEDVGEELMEYYLRNIIETPTVSEMFRFNKKLSKDSIKKGILNLCSQTGVNGRQWEDYLNPDETRQLLWLMGKVEFDPSEWEHLKKLKFKNLIFQAQFEEMAGCANDLIVVESKNTEAYLISVSLDKLSLIDPQRKMDETLLEICEKYVLSILRQAIGLPELMFALPELGKSIVFITYDKQALELANTRKDLVIRWLSKNRSVVIDQAEALDKDQHFALLSGEDAKKITDKILLLESLGDALEDKGEQINKKRSKKI